MGSSLGKNVDLVMEQVDEPVSGTPVGHPGHKEGKNRCKLHGVGSPLSVDISTVVLANRQSKEILKLEGTQSSFASSQVLPEGAPGAAHTNSDKHFY